MITLKIGMELSGHLYRGSVYETANSCGNCNGANCDSCQKTYYIYNNDDMIYSTNDIHFAKEMINPDNKTNVYIELDLKYDQASETERNELIDILNDGALIIGSIYNTQDKRIKFQLLYEDENNIDIPAFIETELKRNKLTNFTITRLESNKKFVNPILSKLVKIHIFLNNTYQVFNNKEEIAKTSYNGYVEIHEDSLHSMLEKAVDILQWKSRGLERPSVAKNYYPGYEYFNIFNIEGDSKYHLLFDQDDDENIWFKNFSSLYDVEDKIKEFYHIQ